MRILCAALAAAIAGCAQAPADDRSPASPSAPARLEGEWRVESLDGAAPPAGAAPTIEFGAEGKLFGNGGCNNYGGGFAYEAGVLTVGPLFSTKMACEPARMDFETRFLERLEGALKATADAGGALRLTDDAGAVLIRPAP